MRGSPVLLVLVAGCWPVVDLEVPEEVDRIAILTVEELAYGIDESNLLRTTGLLEVEAAMRVEAEGHLILGYRDEQIDAFEVRREVARSSPLRPRRDPTKYYALPDPVWHTVVTSAGEEQERDLDLPQLTADWLKAKSTIVPGVLDCTDEYSEETITLPVEGPAGWATRIDEETVLFGSLASHGAPSGVFQMRGTAVVTVETRSNTSAIEGVFRDEDGTLWFGAWDGKILRGTYSAPVLDLETVVTSTSKRTFYSLRVRPEPLEVIAANKEHVPEHYVNGAWRDLFHFDSTAEDDIGGVIAFDDETSIVFDDDDDLLLVVDNGLRVENWKQKRWGAPAGGTVLPDWGPVIGTRDGRIAVYENDWLVIGAQLSRIRAIAQDEEGSLWYADRSGIVAKIARGSIESCVVTQLEQTDICVIVPTVHGILLAGDPNPQTNRLEVVLLQPSDS